MPQPGMGYCHFWMPSLDAARFQSHYMALLSVSQFVSHFEKQASKNAGDQILASFRSGGEDGLKPDDRFFEACSEGQGILGGVFVCALMNQQNKGLNIRGNLRIFWHLLEDILGCNSIKFGTCFIFCLN